MKQITITCEVSSTSTRAVFLLIRGPYAEVLDISEKDLISIKTLELLKKGIPSNKPVRIGRLSNKLRWKILQRDEFKCQVCGREFSDGIKLEVHHIIPAMKGGSDDPENLQTLCKDCHEGIE